ncbi:TonB-dependent receptor plug domain-containing protein [Cognatilysobacter lacus]|uniref:TonB-dependent receptor n=1 Tax=Cognatilysobacter lacus TaxID=1643323 RepID=A0A5D8Z4W1_9GAMM|nr:TonB-dependent receptor [Lysobacter lacus]TZF89707.1 TonB-dependent receptor [Lysobacter lacus]
MKALRRHTLAKAIQLSLLVAVPGLAAAQDATPQQLDTVTITGSRIRQSDKVTSQPVSVITRAQIDQSGATSIGDFLQELTASGKALNAKFNSSGNFGYPASGGGIGAGSAQVDLRNLGSQRVLVLVDGIRWVNESSASGVSGSADLNTIPLAIVERIEVLEDGASAIYGSDAIAGVVNIITKKKFDGVQLHAKQGSYGHGGDDTEADITIGGSTEKFSGVFSAAFVDQRGISSSAWGQSSMPVPGAGLGAGSSATPQGRLTFCDPRIATAGTPGFCDPAGNDWFDLTLNNGATPNYNGGNPTTAPGTYHDWSGADRFNFAPYNLLLTPSKRKSLFASTRYDISEGLSFHAKALYNNRVSRNQAAPEPIFVGPFAGTGGIADTIVIAANNPYNPTQIALDPATNFGWVTRRPLELGPRLFSQDVDTWYVNLGFDGAFNAGARTLDWNVDYVHSENKAEQRFQNGFNVAKLKLALGDVNVCRAVPGCVPLDLFGGQARPITQAMFDYVTTDQRDASKQVLDLFSANLTGDLFDIGDRHAGFAVGAEHRKYQGDFNPDPLRQSGESQDSFAAPISASYHVNELYAEMLVPWLSTFSTDFALRRSQYSTFGGATTGKVGFRWQPMQDLVVRGTWSEGFRAPNLGELYGLTQFGATLVDPCGPTGTPGGAPQYRQRCTAAGVSPTFEQANTQITTFTGGNANLQPEKSKNYNLGFVWSPAWSSAWASRFDFEADYFHYKVTDAIQAPDIQALLNGCYDGSISGAACSGFTRGAGGNLNPPTDFLSNLGTITTSGVDVKVNWASRPMDWGQLTASLQSTHTIGFSAVDTDGNQTQQAVGIEVNDSAIPSWQSNLQLGWKMGDWNLGWDIRYVGAVREYCANAAKLPAANCPETLTIPGPNGTTVANPKFVPFAHLGATTYHDVQASWNHAFGMEGMKLSAGVNNLFGKDAPICVSCSLNGYDAGTYDLPFRFWYVDVQYKF